MKRAKMMSIVCKTLVSVIVMEGYVNRQTRKDEFTTKCIVVVAIFEDSVSRVILVAVNKINKIAESKSPRLGVNEVAFLLDFFNSSCIIQ